MPQARGGASRLATGSRSNHPAQWRLVDFLLHCEKIMNILHNGMLAACEIRSCRFPAGAC